MFRKEFVILCSLAALIFLGVAAAGYWVGRQVQQSGLQIAKDTLPGLVTAGAAMSRMQENWMRTYLLLHETGVRERSTLIRQIRLTSNERLWQQYRESIFQSDDRVNYDGMMSARSNFLKLREEFFTAVQADRIPEAETILETNLAPAYEQYKQTSDKLFRYNANVGLDRAQTIMRISRFGPPILGAFCVLIFTAGFFMGLRGAFSGIDLATRWAGR